MKKKLLLLLATSLSLVTAISAVAITTSNESHFKVTGQNEPSTFSIDYTSVSSIEGESDAYNVLLKSSKGSSINVVIKGLSYRDDHFCTTGSGHDFYLYNTDPIRGINAFGILFAAYDRFESSSQTMFSSSTGEYPDKNPINFDDVLSGHYSDLVFKLGNRSYEYYSYTNYEASTTPELRNSRYFLHHGVIGSSEIALTTLDVQSICDAEPDPLSELGENLGEFTEDEKSILQSNFGNSLNINEAGNPAYAFSGSYFYQYFPKNTTSPFLTQILSNGFTYRLNFDGDDIYQKKVGGTVHTLYCQTKSYDYCNEFSVVYSDDMDYLNRYNSWPSSYINNVLYSKYTDIIPALSSAITQEYVEFFSASTRESSYDRTIDIYVQLKDEKNTEEDIWAVFNAYKEQFDTSVWDVDTYDLYYQDGFLEVYVDDYYDGIFVISIEETTLSSVAPTTSQIAEAIGYDNPSDLTAIHGGSCYYNGRADRYFIYNYTESTVETCIQDLITWRGFEIYSQTSTSTLLIREVNEFGDYLSIFISKSSSYLLVEYAFKTYERHVFASLEDLLIDYEHFSDLVCNQIATSIAPYLSESCEYYRISYEGNYDTEAKEFGVIVNAGSQFISNFGTVFVSNYDESLDAYDFGGYYALKLQRFNNSVRLYFVKNFS